MNSPVMYKRAPECHTQPSRPVEIEITAALYEYVLAGNGLFMQARRPELAVTFAVARGQVRGLAHMETKVRLAGGRVPRPLMEAILSASLQSARDGEAPPREALFHLLYDANHGEWRLVCPQQIQTETSVKPVDDSLESSYARAVIEVHSHHRMQPYFSEQDDRDEQGFRLYGVIGNVGRKDKRPSLRLRIGVYGNFYEIPAAWVFEMPVGLEDAVAARVAAN